MTIPLIYCHAVSQLDTDWFTLSTFYSPNIVFLLIKHFYYKTIFILFKYKISTKILKANVNRLSARHSCWRLQVEGFLKLEITKKTQKKMKPGLWHQSRFYQKLKIQQITDSEYIYESWFIIYESYKWLIHKQVCYRMNWGQLKTLELHIEGIWNPL